MPPIKDGQATRMVARTPPSLVRILLVAPMLAAAAGLVTTLPLDRIAGAGAAPQLAATAAVARVDASAPDAAAALASREQAAETPAPYF